MNKSKFFKLANEVGTQTNTSDGSFWERVKAFFRMIMDIISGNYKPNKKNLLIGIGVLIYVISPIDIIPAFILDDAAIVLLSLKYFKKEIENYLVWEKSKKFKTIITDAEIINEQ